MTFGVRLMQRVEWSLLMAGAGAGNKALRARAHVDQRAIKALLPDLDLCMQYLTLTPT